MKRLFVVFVIVMMIFFVGCQSASVVNFGLNESEKSIFSLNDESTMNAGLVKNESIKDNAYSKYCLAEEYSNDIINAADNDSADFIIQPTSNEIINTDETQYDDILYDYENEDDIDEINYAKDKDESYPQISASSDINTVFAAIQSDAIVPMFQWYPDVTQDNPPTPTFTPVPTSAPTSNTTTEATPISTPTPTPFEIDENNVLVYYSGKESNVTIPEGVSSIGPEAFKNNSHICSVTIPDSVTDIGSSAFIDCISLETITFSSSSCLGTIGSSAFKGCVLLRSINIPRSVYDIGDYAFKNCPLTDTLTFYINITIGQNAFDGSSIQTIILDDKNSIKLTTNTYSFANCSNLSCIRLENPKSQLDLAVNTFSNVNKLTVYVGSGLYVNKYNKSYTKEQMGMIDDIVFVKS